MPDLSSELLPELATWLGWLRARLAPASVALAGITSPPRREVRWRIRFQGGREAVVYVPTYLIRGGHESFEWVTLGMETYDWILLLRGGESTAFELNRNGMLLARNGEEGAA